MEQFDISDKILSLSEQVMADVAKQFELIDKISLTNTQRVLSAFGRHKVTDACFSGTTGYGYDDKGREVLEMIYADVMGTRSALVRIGFVSGTHAISSALFGILKPDETLLSVTGTPYDTLHGVIGISGNYRGSLKDFNINYSQIELNDDGSPNCKAISNELKNSKIKAIYVQRSRGYSPRRTLSVSEIGDICDTVRSTNPDVVVFVDNCYGEFTETIEPGHIGADLIAGSLIKNPGGGLAPTGGYIAGNEELVLAAGYKMTAPGVGGECGATLGINRHLYQGFFLAPHVVAQAVKTAVFSAGLFELLGFRVSPGCFDMRSDIIQMIELGSPDLIERFCKGIQAGAPVDSFVTPVQGSMPGYDCPVIMAAGSFIQGASIELSADAPMREPYNVFLQGGLTFEAGKLGVMLAASYMTSMSN